jgi:hypothetical protein
MDVFRIELPEDLPSEDVTQLVQELHEVDEVVETSSDTRSLTGALVLVKVVGGVLGNVATAVPIVQKVIETIRGKGVTGAKIELPDGTKLSVDNASVEDIERLLAAAVRS